MNELKGSEDQLRAEIELLKRQLAEHKSHRRGPSRGTLVLLALLTLVLIVAGFFAGYLPRQKREQVLAAESKDNARSLPQVIFSQVTRSGANSQLVLPG